MPVGSKRAVDPSIVHGVSVAGEPRATAEAKFCTEKTTWSIPVAFRNLGRFGTRLRTYFKQHRVDNSR